jgi:hypothetical protein
MSEVLAPNQDVVLVFIEIGTDDVAAEAAAPVSGTRSHHLSIMRTVCR